ncbi:MAG: LuxR C-terminal-related transcriptional regulator, partial [Pseudonocardia sp.]|nr:LuxR C-terminal-related transcriptional regulator [Pseudonocardia sp.]
ADAVDRLVGAGLLSTARPLAFAHPLLAQVVAEHTTGAERHRGHLLAARLLAVEGADPQRVAAHVLLTEPLGDPGAVAVLRAAAAAASALGAPAAAVSYLRRALAEPPAAADRATTLAQLGTALIHVETAAGFAALDAALDAADASDVRARIALAASRAARSASDLRTAARFLAAVEPDHDQLDPRLSYELRCETVFVRWIDPPVRAEMVARAHVLAERAPAGGIGEVNVLLTLAFDALDGSDGRSDGGRAADLAERALRLHAAQAIPSAGVLGAGLNVLVALDRVEPARAAVDQALEEARRRGSLLLVGEASVFSAILHHRTGRLADAEADIRVALRISTDASIDRARRWADAWLVRCLVDRGELAEADRVAAGADPGGMSMLCEARGHLRAAQGRHAEALAEFRAAGVRAQRQIRHPALITWRPAAALSLHVLGRTAEARALAAEAERVAADAGSARARGLALRARGLVEGSVAALAASVAELAATPARLEHAASLVELGAALRRAGHRRDARQHLGAGLDLAQDCGAAPLVARAIDEFAAAGGRSSRRPGAGVAALTPSERRVADLAIAGHTNREIAQMLYVTTKTVETHLAAAYRKLGVGRRA